MNDRAGSSNRSAGTPGRSLHLIMASPLPPPTEGRRSTLRSSLVFAGIASLATCIAFVAGKQIREHNNANRHLMPSSSMRLAQAEEPGLPSITVGGSRLQTADRRSTAPVSSTERRKAEEKRTRAAADTFEQVYSLVREHYVDTLPGDRTLSHGAIRAMVSALEDDQSFFLTPQQRTIFENEADGHFAGIGAVTAIRSVKTKEGYTEHQLVLVAPLPDSPAAKAGLKTGDRITHVDGRYILGDNPYLEPNRMPKPPPTPKPTDPSEIDDDDSNGSIRDGVGLLYAQMELRQGQDEKHVLTVRRAGNPSPIQVTVESAITETALPETRTVHGETGEAAVYVRVPAFTEAAVAAVKKAAEQASEDRRIILDLRQNPGIGSLEAAEQMVSALSSGGVFTIEVGVNGKRTPLNAPVTNDPTTPKPTVVVLTDGGTASFAEALAASLSDKGAMLVGQGHTFGDGRVQTLYPLPDDSAFTLTTGKFVGPRGLGWEGVGLVPGVPLPRHFAESAIISHAATIAAKMPRATIEATASLSAERKRGTK